VSDDIAGVLFHHRDRIKEIADVFARYGFARLADHAAAALDTGLRATLVARIADPDLAALTSGQRLRGALSELGTTWIKFGQMLSLHPDLVGNDVAAELAQLQSNVPPDPPGSTESTIKAELGVDVGDAFGTPARQRRVDDAPFEATPMASASVAQAHRASLKDGTPVVVKVVHSGAQAKVLDDLELMRVLAGFVEDRDEALAAYSPTVVVDEFDMTMRAAIDLGKELANLHLFTANFADEHDVVIPRPYPEVSSTSVLTMSLLTGTKASGRDSVIATGWDVDDLVRRASNIYLEMVFRDGVYHADPHPGNFLLPDGQHLAILDFGDIGHLSGPRKNQLEALLMAVGSRDVDEITDIVIDITHAPADVDTDRLSGQLETWLSRYLGGSVADLDFVGMVNSGMQIMHSNRLTFPSDLALLFRVFVQLQGLGSSLGAKVSLTELLQPYWDEMMLERLNPVSVARRALRTLRGWERLLATAPTNLRPILRQLQDGTIGVEFRIHDADGVTDRLVDGILAAASILASAELIGRRTGPRIRDVSIPGAIALTVGVVTWRRLLANRVGHRSSFSRIRQLVVPPSQGSAPHRSSTP
jgi:ubiquinone biosynthesis protein